MHMFPTIICFNITTYVVNVTSVTLRNVFRNECIIWPGAKVIKKFGAWIGAQLKISCSKIRKLRSGDYKQVGVGFLCSV